LFVLSKKGDKIFLTEGVKYMAESSNDYFGINKIISAILALFFGWILSPIVRIMEGKVVAGIVRLLLDFVGIGFILSIIDFVLILVDGKILRVIES
jgi:TM2 domain-containing membrane protein YozV